MYYTSEELGLKNETIKFEGHVKKEQMVLNLLMEIISIFIYFSN